MILLNEIDLIRFGVLYIYFFPIMHVGVEGQGRRSVIFHKKFLQSLLQLKHGQVKRWEIIYF